MDALNGPSIMLFKASLLVPVPLFINRTNGMIRQIIHNDDGSFIIHH